MSVLVVGSIAIDTVKTPVEEHSDLLGGSASYAALGASFFSPVRLVGIVGNDFPESEFQFWKSRKIDSGRRDRVLAGAAMLDPYSPVGNIGDTRRPEE